MNKKQPIVIQDTKEIQNIFIQINLKKGTTMIYSNFSAWENMAYLMEALATTMEQCVNEGMDKKEVYQELNRYMTQVIGDYKIIK
jgi:hypothetical protein